MFLNLKYDKFTDEVISELVKIIKYKELENETRTILEYLKNKPQGDFFLKKDLKSLFTDKTQNTVYKYIEALEYVGAVIYKKIGSMYVYEITPIGLKMYELLSDDLEN